MKMKRLLVYVTLTEGLQVLMFAFGAAAIQEAFEPVISVTKLVLSAFLGVALFVLVVFMYFKMFLDTAKQK